jgi:hypothetical protein
MNRIKSIGWRRLVLRMGILALLAMAGMRLCASGHREPPEISLVLGEPYEDMRKRSSAQIAEAIPGEAWFRMPRSDARLRFNDPVYGFTTPTARYFTVGFSSDKVRNVHMSPQIEPLRLDDAIRVALDLQDQWRRGGWVPLDANEWPPVMDNKEWRDRLHACKFNAGFWRAGDKYQTQLGITCFADPEHPKEARYLISLEISRPY